MALLISTNMYKAEEFKRILPYVEKWKGQVGVCLLYTSTGGRACGQIRLPHRICLPAD